jgi:hypothetical protein
MVAGWLSIRRRRAPLLSRTFAWLRGRWKTCPVDARTILIFGDAGAQAGEAHGPESNRVPVETIKANLKTAMESVGELVQATREAVGDLHVCHMDVGVAIASDGSVGLLGMGANDAEKATFTVRIKRVIPGSRRYT